MVSLEKIFGAGIPDSVAGSFRGKPDEQGYVDWLEVSSCPLAQVDPLSPAYNPGWLVDVYEQSQGIAAKLPAHWLIEDPSPVLIDSVCLIRSEVERAGLYKSENNEDW